MRRAAVRFASLNSEFPMFRRCWIVLALCFGTVASAQSTPELEKVKSEARAAYEEHDYKKADELISKVIAQNPKDHSALSLRATTRVEMGVEESVSDPKEGTKSIREGIEDARESLKIGGGSEINYYLPYFFGMISLARIENKRDHANVVVEHSKAVLARPNVTPEQRANVLYQRANAYIFLQDLKSAIEDFQAAIKAFPGHLGSYMGLADTYIFAGQPDKALATFTSAVEAFPTSPLVYNNRGLFLQSQERFAESISDFNKAIELEKDFAIAYANRGFSNQGLGNLQVAEVDFNQAISLQPQNPRFYSLRGTCRLSQGNATGALADFNEAVRLFDKNPVARSDIGFAKFFMKDYAGASAEFEMANQMDPVAMRYLSPWRVWSLVLAAKSDVAAPIVSLSSSKPEKERDWIDEQVLFLNGKDVSERDLVDFVSKATDPKLKKGQLCEAYYFIAERRAQANDKVAATAFYKEVLGTKATQLSAYRGAQYALQAFGK